MTEEKTQSDGDRQPLEESSPLRGKSSWIPRCLRRMLPPGFLDEVKEQFAMAGPVILSQIMVLLVNIVSCIFCGHLGKIELDSVILAVAVINVTGISIGAGLSSACDTLISQTYGGRNLKRIGTIIQRGILILLLFCFPCWAIFINAEHILLLFRQNPDVARLTQTYMMIYTPALPAVFLYQLELRYLQNQGIMWPQVFTSGVVNLINAGAHAVLLYVLKLGIVGSAMANAISQVMMCSLLYIYIYMRKLHVETWKGWSKDCLQEWGSFMRLAISSMLMLCIELWSFEIGGFLAGLINMVELGAQAIMLQMASAGFTITVGLSSSASVKVGNALGAGDVEQAKFSTNVSLICTASFAILVGVFIAALKGEIAYIFTSDRDIITLVSKLLLIFALYHAFDAFATTSAGVLRGTGMQKYGAIIIAIGYYVIGLPIGISLMFSAKLGVIGLWIGIAVCIFLQAILFLIFIMKLNWNKICKEAQVRAGVKQSTKKKDPRPIILKTEKKKDIAETGNIQSIELKCNIKQHVSTDKHPILSDNESAGEYEDMSAQKEDSTTAQENIVGDVLTVKQLIVWRGLAVVLAVATLIIGITFKFIIGKGQY
ncbi:multidrug and toxin extrusion protein 2-like [Pelobates fuscus]|uniref:multidrug and toxin extrusion protein 2-like n=1 Tax=Pelobates fuscus TaxID=191477 RepID=UPI002FE44178